MFSIITISGLKCPDEVYHHYMSFSAVLMKGPGPHFPVVNEISGTGYAGASLMNLIEQLNI